MRLLRTMMGVAALAGVAGMGIAQAPTEPAPADDPFTFLEEIQGERALAWARAENERTLGVLQADPRYAVFNQRALEILQARDRIPGVAFRPDGLYNFWQDATHVKGI